jgi:hypothetical protein
MNLAGNLLTGNILGGNIFKRNSLIPSQLTNDIKKGFEKLTGLNDKNDKNDQKNEQQPQQQPQPPPPVVVIQKPQEEILKLDKAFFTTSKCK